MKTGLALSGGGFRATLFSLGSLFRLNQAGLLPKIDTITSVSGGAITAGYLAYKWSTLDFDKKGIALNFNDEVANPLINFCNETIDYPSAIQGIFSVKNTIGEIIAKKYDKYLFNNILLHELSEKNSPPEFVFYGTNYDTGVSVQITKEYLRDYRVGKASNHNISLAQAVGISSAFPPFFSPIELDGSAWSWEPTKYSDLYHDESIRKKLMLCDGGLYDNLGIEKLWKVGNSQKYKTVFVCDSSAPFEAPYKYSKSLIGNIKQLIRWRKNWMSQFIRITDIMATQQRALRTRQLIANLSNPDAYGGAYWGIDTKIEDYPDIIPMVNSSDYIGMIELPTQLRPFSSNDRDSLINWSFALTDAALRSRYDNTIEVAAVLPRKKSIKNN